MVPTGRKCGRFGGCIHLAGEFRALKVVSQCHLPVACWSATSCSGTSEGSVKSTSKVTCRAPTAFRMRSTSPCTALGKGHRPNTEPTSRSPMPTSHTSLETVCGFRSRRRASTERPSIALNAPHHASKAAINPHMPLRTERILRFGSQFVINKQHGIRKTTQTSKLKRDLLPIEWRVQ